MSIRIYTGYRYWFVIALFLLISSCTNSNSKKRQVRENSTVTFGICTDVHYNVIHDANRRLEIFVDKMNEQSRDFVIELGDFCYPDSTSNSFLNIYNSFNGDKYFVLGNHDRDNGATQEKTVKYFGMPSPYYSFDKKEFHFIVLNGNEKLNNSQEGYSRYISNKQLNWLNNDLKKTDKETVVFVHQSLFDSHGVINRDTVRTILAKQHTKDGKRKVLVCFSGHSHVDAAERIDSIWYVAINSMSYHWVGEDYKHLSYPDSVHKSHPWIEYVCPYKDPLFASVTINKSGTVTIKGTDSEWQGESPDSLGFISKYYKPEWIVPRVSSRILNQD